MQCVLVRAVMLSTLVAHLLSQRGVKHAVPSKALKKTGSAPEHTAEANILPKHAGSVSTASSLAGAAQRTGPGCFHLSSVSIAI
jgi:hypothetical protein